MKSYSTSTRRFLPCIMLSLALVAPLLSTNTTAQELKFYRYKNASGITVISTRIPSKFVRKGYDIVTRDGRLIKSIPAEPSAEEKQKILEAQAEAERLKKRDRQLLSRYSSVSDIEADRARKLALFDTDLMLRKRNIEKINEETTLWQSKAADEERRGQAVSAATLDKLVQLKAQKEAIELAIQQKQKEQQQAIDRYASDIARFKIIRPE